MVIKQIRNYLTKDQHYEHKIHCWNIKVILHSMQKLLSCEGQVYISLLAVHQRQLLTNQCAEQGITADAFFKTQKDASMKISHIRLILQYLLGLTTLHSRHLVASQMLYISIKVYMVTFNTLSKCTDMPLNYYFNVTRS